MPPPAEAITEFLFQLLTRDHQEAREIFKKTLETTRELAKKGDSKGLQKLHDLLFVTEKGAYTEKEREAIAKALADMQKRGTPKSKALFARKKGYRKLRTASSQHLRDMRIENEKKMLKESLLTGGSNSGNLPNLGLAKSLHGRQMVQALRDVFERATGEELKGGVPEGMHDVDKIAQAFGLEDKTFSRGQHRMLSRAVSDVGRDVLPKEVLRGLSKRDRVRLVHELVSRMDLDIAKRLRERGLPRESIAPGDLSKIGTFSLGKLVEKRRGRLTREHRKALATLQQLIRAHTEVEKAGKHPYWEGIQNRILSGEHADDVLTPIRLTTKVAKQEIGIPSHEDMPLRLKDLKAQLTKGGYDAEQVMAAFYHGDPQGISEKDYLRKFILDHNDRVRKQHGLVEGQFHPSLLATTMREAAALDQAALAHHRAQVEQAQTVSEVQRAAEGMDNTRQNPVVRSDISNPEDYSQAVKILKTFDGDIEGLRERQRQLTDYLTKHPNDYKTEEKLQDVESALQILGQTGDEAAVAGRPQDTETRIADAQRETKGIMYTQGQRAAAQVVQEHKNYFLSGLEDSLFNILEEHGVNFQDPNLKFLPDNLRQLVSLRAGVPSHGYNRKEGTWFQVGSLSKLAKQLPQSSPVQKDILAYLAVADDVIGNRRGGHWMFNLSKEVSSALASHEGNHASLKQALREIYRKNWDKANADLEGRLHAWASGKHKVKALEKMGGEDRKDLFQQASDWQKETYDRFFGKLVNAVSGGEGNFWKSKGGSYEERLQAVQKSAGLRQTESVTQEIEKHLGGFFDTYEEKAAKIPHDSIRIPLSKMLEKNHAALKRARTPGGMKRVIRKTIGDFMDGPHRKIVPEHRTEFLARLAVMDLFLPATSGDRKGMSVLHDVYDVLAKRFIGKPHALNVDATKTIRDSLYGMRVLPALEENYKLLLNSKAAGLKGLSKEEELELWKRVAARSKDVYDTLFDDMILDLKQAIAPTLVENGSFGQYGMGNVPDMGKTLRGLDLPKPRKKHVSARTMS